MVLAIYKGRGDRMLQVNLWINPQSKSRLSWAAVPSGVNVMPSKGRRFGWRKVARISRSWTSEWANLSPNDAGHHVMLCCWNSLKKYISLAKVPNLWRLQTLRHQDQEFLVKKVAARALAKAPRQAPSWQALASFFVAEVLKQSFKVL